MGVGSLGILIVLLPFNEYMQSKYKIYSLVSLTVEHC